MELKLCTSGTVIISLGADFENITIKAVGERINKSKGFCLSIGSITQIEPCQKNIEPIDQKRIAQAIAKWDTASVYFEFYEEL